jgi:hypothetical protein
MAYHREREVIVSPRHPTPDTRPVRLRPTQSNQIQPGPTTPTQPCRLAFGPRFGTSLEMGLPSQPVTLTVEALGELNRQLANMRHDINNNLSLIVAAAELMRHKPAVAERMMNTLAEQPGKITTAINKFSATFEQALGITRP